MNNSQTASGPQAISTAPSPMQLREQYRSPNCKADETATTMFTYFAHDQMNPDMQFTSFMLSCQKSKLDVPDADTMKNMKAVASESISLKHNKPLSEIEVAVKAHGLSLGTQNLEKTASELSKNRMASNCAPHYNLNHVTSYNRFTCRYLGKGLDENGKMVQNPFQTWKGVLPSCDRSFDIGDDVEQDVRKLVWEAAGGLDAALDVDQFMCSIHSIPIQ